MRLFRQKALVFITMLVLFVCMATTAFAEKIPANTSNTSNKYSSDWVYWSQGASKYPNFRTYGCRVVAQAKMLVESGVVTDSSFNPDVYQDWCQANGYTRNDGYELKPGQAPIAYAAMLGKKISLGENNGVITFPANISRSEQCSMIMDYLNKGYYVILSCGSHQAYVSREASLQAGTPIIYDSWKSSSYNSAAKVKYMNYESVWPSAPKFGCFRIFSIDVKSEPHTVTYLLNGGNGDYYVQEYKTGEQVQINNIKPTRAGYTFVQWWDGTNVHNPGDTFIMPNSNVNLTAEWRSDSKIDIVISGENWPEKIKVGSHFGLRGIISTNYGVISTVYGEILDSNGQIVQSAFCNPNEQSHDLRYSINNDLIFNTLPVGDYTYVLSAGAVDGNKSSKKILIEHDFSVISEDNAIVISISGQNVPDTHTRGKNFGIRGIVSTNRGVITKVYGVILDSNGNVVQSGTHYPNEQSHNLQYSINNDLIFERLAVGTYIYRVEITAEDGDQTKTEIVIDHSFTVKDDTLVYL